MKTVVSLLICVLAALPSPHFFKPNHIPTPPTQAAYANAENWLRLGEHDGEVAAPADTFYIYPSCSWKSSEDLPPQLCGLDDAQMRKQAELWHKAYGGIFTKSTNVYVPYYRQLSLEHISNLSGVWALTLGLFGLNLLDELQYQINRYGTEDCLAAFRYYLERLNPGCKRPIVFASYSQGSFALRGMLDRIANDADCADIKEKLRGKIIAVYIPGFPFTPDILDNGWREQLGLEFASDATSYGKVISYNTQGPLAKNNYFVKHGSLAINPLTWNTAPGNEMTAAQNQTFSRMRNFNTADPPIDETETRDFTHFTGAKLIETKQRFWFLWWKKPTSGQAILAEQSPNSGLGLVDSSLFGSFGFGRDVYHGYDYGLFYESLQLNVSDRIAAQKLSLAPAA